MKQTIVLILLFLIGKIVRLEPNTLTGLAWGLSNFDGVEFDIRLTKDNELVIFHDVTLASGEYISQLTLSELQKREIPSLQQFLELPLINELTSDNRHLWIEMKPNCDGKQRIADPIKETMATSLLDTLDRVDINRDAIRVISFAKSLLAPITDIFPTYPLIPDITECNERFRTIRGLWQFFRHNIVWHLNQAVEFGYAGILFARQYVHGILSHRHISYEKLVNLSSELDIEIGTNFADPNLETKYPMLHRFSDKLAQYPRHRSDDQYGDIIAHRGTGVKGLEIPETEMPAIDIS